MKAFEEIKTECQQLINANKHRIVDRTTTKHDAGIYMIYVDSFNDDKIIPIYIGQTSDFQKRHQQHLTEIMALNRCLNKNYEYALYKNVYHGNYRACKIFSYMVTHNCTFSNLHMIILEIVDNENERKVIEKQYIDKLLAAFVGFNQINSVSMSFAYAHSDIDKEEFESIVESDINNFIDYAQYGYNSFNFLLSSEIFNQERKTKILSSQNGRIYSQYLNLNSRLDETRSLKLRATHVINECEAHLVKSCKQTIEQFCKNRKIQTSYQRYSYTSQTGPNVVDYVIGFILFNIDSYHKSLVQHFLNSGHDEIVVDELFDFLNLKHKRVINTTKQKVLDNQKCYREAEEERDSILKQIFSTIFPTQPYKSHPLKDSFVSYEFKDEQPENTCYINIEYTCFKSKENLCPEICKIDCRIKLNDSTHIFSEFISNGLTNFFNNDFAYYEKDAVTRMLCRRNPFNLRLYGNATTHIPVTMEYKNGINEFTLSSHEAKSSIDVFKEIDAIVPSDIKIVYTTHGTKSAIKHCFKKDEIEQIPFLKRLIKMLK